MRVGLNLETSLDENLVVTRYKLPEFSRLGLMNRPAIKALTDSIIDRFDVIAARQGGGIATLSGGNLQKVVLAREITAEARVLLAMVPTRGLDAWATAEVRRQMLAARERGAAILLASEDLDEVLSLSDRVVVMTEGRIVFTAAAGDLDRSGVGRWMTSAGGADAR